jgi:hypothetical protein
MKLSLSVLVVFLAVGLVGFSRGKSRVARDKGNNATQPDRVLVDRLDHVIQERFLTAPFFGARRIGPQPNPHLDHFRAKTPEERDTVAAIESGGWKVGIYLMGRRGYPEVASIQDQIEKIHVEKRLSLPVPVTKRLEPKTCRASQWSQPSLIQPLPSSTDRLYMILQSASGPITPARCGRANHV